MIIIRLDKDESKLSLSLLRRHNGQDSVSNHQPHHCLLSRLFGHRAKKTSKLRVTGLCAANSPRTDEFPAQMASNAKNVSIWWRHRGIYVCRYIISHSTVIINNCIVSDTFNAVIITKYPLKHLVVWCKTITWVNKNHAYTRRAKLVLFCKNSNIILYSLSRCFAASMVVNRRRWITVI